MGEKATSELFCYLAMPGYGNVSAGAARGFWRATRRPDTEVRREYKEGSLLAAGFNHTWANALNLARKGRCPRYYAMQHADIEPEAWWLDTLVEELERRDLDVLGVVAPIKDSNGRTSIALAHPTGDTWRVKCRLTMSEVYRLPETFTSEDVGAPLLLNTGLWVCRFAEDWARQVRFTINDEIVFNTKTDRYEVQCESEDWYFSRLLHEMGKRVGCTRKVQLAHVGNMRFLNTHPWGREEFDSAHVSESQIPPQKADGFRFPHDAAGWLTYAEGRALFDYAAGKTVLEIGSYCGRSTVCLAQSAESVACVDPFDGRATGEAGDTMRRFMENTARYGVSGRVTAHVGTSAEVLPEFPRESFDFVFVDGAHDAPSVREDIRLAREVLRPGGLLAFHDYAHAPRWGDDGVREAVNELLASGGHLVSTHDSLAVVRPPALALSEV